MHPIFTTNFGVAFQTVLYKYYKSFLPLIMLPVKHKSDHEQAGQAAKRGLAVVEDMFFQEFKQFEAELEAEGLPIDSSPLEVIKALVA